MPGKIRINNAEDKLEMPSPRSEEMAKEINPMREKIAVMDTGEGRS